ncbi:MAG: DUF6353 family protein [Oscillospiraceae bacterium]|jgi:hypothetical protein|nr:DUF6353 family protein [Oscillospiraceae bacterium]
MKSIIKSIKKHSPEFLTGLGIAGMLTTTVLAVKATPKAIKLIENEDFSNVEIVKTTWKLYIPSAITGVISISCLIGASAVNIHRNAVLTTAFALSETAMKEYRDKVIESVGEKKEKTIRDEVLKDKINANPTRDAEVIFTNTGNTLCYDVISGRYFRSDIEKLKRMENEINRELLQCDFVTVNDLYYEIGLDDTSIGNDLGWHSKDGLIELFFSSQLTKQGEPCLVMDYKVAPKYFYCG